MNGKGKNMKGINLATQKLYEFSSYEQRDLESKKCVFLSHRNADKDKVLKIGEYIKNAGLNIYLDVNDSDLQVAVTAQNAKKITECIQRGLSFSNYMICAISSNTFDENSWWVPYEIGYSDKEKKECCLLKLSNLKKDQIPEYLKIKQILYNISDLNKKIKAWSTNVNEWSAKGIYSLREGLLSETATDHVLVNILDRV